MENGEKPTDSACTLMGCSDIPDSVKDLPKE